MKMSTYLDGVVIVLYQPQDIVNVAGTIRVMSNFGLPALRLVEPAAFDPYRIEGIAHGTQRLVAATQRFPSLEEAVADCSFVVGTTSRSRTLTHRVMTPREAAPRLVSLAAKAEQRVAVLFGREQDGLPNSALKACHGLVRIPTHPDNPSLNLAQAALVLAYELWQAASGGESPAAEGEPANLARHDEREAMFAALGDLLTTLYPHTNERRLNAALARLRAMLMRAEPRSEETAALTNLIRHATRALRER